MRDDEQLFIGRGNELEEYRSLLKGGVTPKHLIEVLIKELNNDGIEELVVVRKLKSGLVVSGWTQEEGISTLGMIEYLRAHVWEEI